jgi:hypothetical protein
MRCGNTITLCVCVCVFVYAELLFSLWIIYMYTTGGTHSFLASIRSVQLVVLLTIHSCRANTAYVLALITADVDIHFICLQEHLVCFGGKIHVENREWTAKRTGDGGRGGLGSLGFFLFVVITDEGDVRSLISNHALEDRGRVGE